MSWKYKALLHAQREDPKESCGLLLNVKGKERYYPCRNLSITDISVSLLIQKIM